MHLYVSDSIFLAITWLGSYCPWEHDWKDFFSLQLKMKSLMPTDRGDGCSYSYVCEKSEKVIEKLSWFCRLKVVATHDKPYACSYATLKGDLGTNTILCVCGLVCEVWLALAVALWIGHRYMVDMSCLKTRQLFLYHCVGLIKQYTADLIFHHVAHSALAAVTVCCWAASCANYFKSTMKQLLG